ncbi:inorganic phosphate transporter [uncultured Varibaculum sp.]|uniref:inorganic phosphate transporter n=1 Tax=uncultured Varibaculum sp. TaxID=413896 RepID=UPI002593DE79|nr:inorganic phosphate transporter [uncultured Varibaculum sp.]
MDTTMALVIAVVTIALIFDFTNGFHDAANAIATCVSTRSMRPKSALLMAAIMNVIGAMLGTGVAQTIGNGIIDISHFTDSTLEADRQHGLVIILAALVGAIIWNIITWYFGLPSSSSHALIGGMAGVGLAAAITVQWMGIVSHVLIPMVVSPLLGFFTAYFVMRFLLSALKRASYHRTMNNFRFMQRFSAAAMALGHGLQDAQKTMGIITMALLAAGYHATDADGSMQIPLWVKLAAAGAISVGTYFGGGRIMHTLGSKVIDVTPAHGFVAETTSASILYITAFLWHAPISTTQSVSSAIMGVGATKRLSAVRWGVAGNIATAWVLTLPGAGLIGALSYFLVHAIFPY